MAKKDVTSEGDTARTARPRPLFLINRVRSAMLGRLADAYRTVRITPAVGEVLNAVALEGDASASDISRRLGITPQSTKQSIHTLEALGYIERSQSVRDERVMHVHITDDGVKALRVCLAALDRMYDDVFRTLKPRERETLTTLLIKVVRSAHPEVVDLYRDRKIVFSTDDDG